MEQTREIPVNIHTSVKVRLTRTGLEHLKKEGHSVPEMDEYGFRRFSLLNIMYCFGCFGGDLLCCGSPSPFENNELIITEKTS
jgi:hypothetical protein